MAPTRSISNAGVRQVVHGTLGPSHAGTFSSDNPRMPASGYSGTPLAKKLGIAPGSTLVLVGAPEGFERLLEGLPANARVVRRIVCAPELIVWFARSRAEVQTRMAVFARDMGAGLWIAWPKKASGVATDMTEDVVREVALPRGLVDNKVCAIDETWSGLKFVYRLKDRPPGREPA